MPEPAADTTAHAVPGFTWRQFLRKRALLLLVNLVIQSLFMLVLRLYEKKGALSKWDLRWFTTLVLLLAAALSGGIGYLLDDLGLIMRGRMIDLWKERPPGRFRTEDIDYILRGTLGSYTKYLWSEIWCSKGAMSHGGFFALAFLSANIIGRLSVAVFGLTFGTDEGTLYAQVPSWPSVDSQTLLFPEYDDARVVEFLTSSIDNMLPPSLYPSWSQHWISAAESSGLHLQTQPSEGDGDEGSATSELSLRDNFHNEHGLIYNTVTCRKQWRLFEFKSYEPISVSVRIFALRNSDLLMIQPDHREVQNTPGVTVIDVAALWMNPVTDWYVSALTQKFIGKGKFMSQVARCSIQSNFTASSAYGMLKEGAPSELFLQQVAGLLNPRCPTNCTFASNHGGLSWLPLDIYRDLNMTSLAGGFAMVLGTASWHIHAELPRSQVALSIENTLDVVWFRAIFAMLGVLFLQIMITTGVGWKCQNSPLVQDDDASSVLQLISHIRRV